MAVRSTQPVREMSARNISWGRIRRPVRRLTTLPLSGANGLEIWEADPRTNLRACPGIALLLN